MSYNQQQVETHSQALTRQLGEQHQWQWEEQRQMLLSEFSKDKIDSTLTVLRENYSHEWDRKSIKKAPKDLKQQLGELATLYKEQKLFTQPAEADQPAAVAVWWPWGHGGTVSLRIKPLAQSYTLADIPGQSGWFARIRQLFSRPSV
ncbi:hypothetical protein SG34_010695 [Thalassomonas viridans]|uniref:Uncharacterized protein n=1 Tax=Thalassomonas viridans TaxID=137584 RepID=A0AAE9Z6U1_9GAMM|nr:hypothetical protein [Thalassomonas viridans]WDE07312.1 hypothetical protein SG34_010695 [Thalassomonas viridans]